MANGIDIILADHERVKALFAEFDADANGAVVGQILDALSAHDAAEHAALNPFATAILGNPALLDRVDQAHMKVQSLMEHVRGQEGPALVQAVAQLQVAVTDHVGDEETHLLSALQKKATTAQLETLATRIEQNKQRVG